jgi:hypothetical protein
MHVMGVSVRHHASRQKYGAEIAQCFNVDGSLVVGKVTGYVMAQ